MIRFVRYLHDTIVQVRSSSRASLARFNAKPIGVGPNTAPSTGFDWLILSEKSSLHTNFRGLTNFRTLDDHQSFDHISTATTLSRCHQISTKLRSRRMPSPLFSPQIRLHTRFGRCLSIFEADPHQLEQGSASSISPTACALCS